MFMLGHTPVLTNVHQILVTLQRELKQSGSPLLRDVMPTAKDTMITCPFHKNGLERKPSCGVSNREVNGVPAGTFHCFSCSKTGDITELISHCLGIDNDLGVAGRRWVLDRFSNFEVENREGFFKKIGAKKETSEIEYITEEELEKYRYIHPYMYRRGLTDEIIDAFDIGYDASFRLKEGLKPFECITFPIKDEVGNVIFVARRSIKGKIFHYPTSVEKGLCYIYEVQKMFPESSTLWIVESLFNALTLIRWGKPAVALLGTGSSKQIERLRTLPYRKYVLITDGDEAGRKALWKLTNALNKYKLLERIEMPNGKDVNDFRDCRSYEEFLQGVNKT